MTQGDADWDLAFALRNCAAGKPLAFVHRCASKRCDAIVNAAAAFHAYQNLTGFPCAAVFILRQPIARADAMPQIHLYRFDEHGHIMARQKRRVETVRRRTVFSIVVRHKPDCSYGPAKRALKMDGGSGTFYQGAGL